MLKLAPLLWILCLSSCNGFNWQPHFWEFDDTGIVNAEGRIIYFGSEDLLEYSCLSKQSIAELKAEISRVKSRNEDYLETYDY